MKRNFKSVIFWGFVFVIAYCSEILAGDVIPCKDNEENCWKCGSTCYARLSSNGQMTLAGTGSTYSSLDKYVWKDSLSLITSVKIEEGITQIGMDAFWSAPVTKVEIADSVEKIQNGAFQNTNITSIIIGENSHLNFLNGPTALQHGPSIKTIYCKGSKKNCEDTQALFSGIGQRTIIDYYSEKNENEEVTLQYFDNGYRVLNDQGFYDVYDMAGNLTGYSNLNGREIYDQSGALLERYDENGNMLDGQQLRADGSSAILKDGKVIGFKGKKIYTVDEATLVTRNNKNTFKLKYR